MKKLTAKQALVLDFMRKFHAEQDQLPPFSHVAEFFGWKSQNAARDFFLVLERKGYIEKNALGVKYRFTRDAGGAS